MADDLDDPHDADIFAPVRDASYKHISLHTVQGIARITLNRAPANVLSIDMMIDINTALESLEYARDVKLVVLAAAGKYFSAGFELTDHLGDKAYVMLENFRKIFENLLKLEKPTLAVVAGPAPRAGGPLPPARGPCLAAPPPAQFRQPELEAALCHPPP